VLLKERGRFEEAEAELGRAIRLWAELAEEHADDADVQEQLAAAYYQRGTVLARQAGRENEAEEAYGEALRRQQRLVAAGPNPDCRRALARTLNNVGLLRMRMGRPDFDQAIRQALDTQEALVRRSPVPTYCRELARSHNNWGGLLALRKKPAEAEQAYQKAEQLLAPLMRDFPRVPAYALEWSAVQINLGRLWQATDRDKAEAALREALRVRQRLVDEFGENPDHWHKLAEAHRLLGLLLTGNGRSTDAEREYRQAVDILGRLTRQFPAASEYQLTRGWTLSNLGQLLFTRSELGEPGQGVDLLLAPASGNAWAAVGPVARARAALGEAADCFGEAIVAQEAARGPSPQDLSLRQFLRSDYRFRAECLLRLGRPAEAAAAAEQLPRFFPDGPDDCYTAATLLVRCAYLAGQQGQSNDDYPRRAVVLLEQAVTKGYRNAKALEDRFFEPLTRRADFQQLLKRLREQTERATG
jgi:tetratricopeptide (TPR) repeat protein